MNDKLNKLLGVFVKKASADIGADYLNNFEGIDHQALIHLAEGVLLQADRLESEFDDDEIIQKLRAIAEKKADLFKQAAMQMVPLDKEGVIILKRGFGDSKSDEDIIADWSRHYPSLAGE